MASFNKVILMGNLTREPELRYTQGGTEVVEVGIATNRKWKDKQTGNVNEEVTFVDCTFWGRTAAILAEYCSKGSAVHVEGRLKLDQWEERETGAKRSKLKVVVDSLQLLPQGNRSGGNGGQSSGSPQPNESPENNGEPYQPGPVGDDEVPF